MIAHKPCYVVELSEGYYSAIRFLNYIQAEQFALDVCALRIWCRGKECETYKVKRNKKKSFMKMNHKKYNAMWQ